MMTATTAVILAFYFFFLVVALLLGALLLVELVVALALLRFGLVGLISWMVEAHFQLFLLSLKSLWLPSESAVYRIPLERADAPTFFALIDSLAQRFGVKPPDRVELEMSVNAWVHLKGLRAGMGETKLGIGYDLLAGLNQSEVEAVLAHEMAHAKLVQRGFSRFANSTLRRCGVFMMNVWALVDHARVQQKRAIIAEMVWSAADLLTRQIARLVAAYSRQDEFEADRGAAEVCGPNALRSGLLKLERLNEAAMRLPWRERVAQLQSGQSYSEWFARELTSALVADKSENAPRLFDKYSSHPALEDRLAALPADVAHEANNAAGLGLLASPDASAEKLMAEIQRVAALEEEKDSKALAKWQRKTMERKATRPLELVGVAMIILALIVGVGTFLVDEKMTGVAVAVVGIAIGIGIYRAGKYRDSYPMAIPEYGILVHAREKPIEVERQEEFERDIQSAVEPVKMTKASVEVILQEGYKALEKCDYLRAHVAARECFKFDKKNEQGHMIFAVACAGVYQIDQAFQALQFVQFHTGFGSASTAWAAAWTFVLAQDYAAAEALLESAIAKHKVPQPTLLSLLALARSRRGKINSAIAKAREVSALAPADKEPARLFISLLIDAGLLREASAEIEKVRDAVETDIDLQIEMVRLNMLTRRIEEAERWTTRLVQSDLSVPRALTLAHVYHGARDFERATRFYHQAIGSGHYPEALLGLAQIDLERKDKAPARERLLRALSLKTELPKDAAGPLPLFWPIVSALTMIEEPAMCSAWNATLPSTGRFHEALSNSMYLILAPTQEEAQRLLMQVLTDRKSVV